MSVTTSGKAIKFFDASIGKKVVMAVTGLLLFGYLVAHMLGNLQLFGGPTGINHYAELLHSSPRLLWGARTFLIAAVVLHIRAAIQLNMLKAEARPVAYTKKAHRGSTLPSRFMVWTGFALAAFIIFHILHFTTGHVHSDFVPDDVFHNVTSAFRNPAIAGVYVVSMAFLALHLHHGLTALFHSLGVSQPRWVEMTRTWGGLVAVGLAALFAIIPIAVVANLVK